MLKGSDFIGGKPVLCGVFRPISPYFVLGLGSQKVVKSFSSKFVEATKALKSFQ